MIDFPDIGIERLSAHIDPPPKTVLAAMSGGIDSTFSALALKKAGIVVTGVFFETGQFEWKKPPSPPPAELAEKAAREIGVELIIIDVAKRFREEVVQPFAMEYTRGRTPNPCMACNPLLKFKALVETADELGIDAVATGHHARIEPGQLPMLLKGKDKKKDQSYFLARLSPETIARSIFPAGLMKKDEIKALLSDLGVSAGSSAESQDICFAGPEGYRRIVESLAPASVGPGRIVTLEGEELGEHHGIHLYTVGQRKGLDVSAPEPLYVVDIDPSENLVIVGPAELTFSEEARVSDLAWLVDPPGPEQTIEIKIRYKSAPAKARLNISGACGDVLFDEPQRAITPGQSAVFYRAERVLGAGFFERTPLSERHGGGVSKP